MSDPAESSVQNLLPVQAYFDSQDNFQTFIGQNKPFYATVNPEQSGLHITDSTIDSTTIGADTPSTGVFTNVNTTTGTISTAPVGNTDIVNKQYVDAIVQGLKPKQDVKCTTTINITLSGLQTIDTYTTLAGDRVLVKNQDTSSENGIYIAAAGAWTRASDMDVWSEVPGAYTVILNGTLGQTGWVCNAADTGTIGVTAMPWVQFSAASTYYAGTGLTLAANTFSITNTGVTADTKGSASKTVTATVNAQGQLTSLTDQDIAIAGTQITSGTIDSARLSGSYTGITGVGTLTAGTWNATTVDVAYGGTGATTLTGYVKGSGTSALTASSTIPNTDITGLGTMSTQDASNVAITGGSVALGTLKTLGLTGYLYGNDTSAVTASTTIPNTAITGLGSISTQNANNVAITGGYATGLTNLGTDYVQLNTGATVTAAVGRVWWDGGTTMNMGMTANVTSHVSEDTFFYVKASGAITKGQLCSFTGVVGASGVITAAPAGAGITNADYIVGVAAEDIASGSFGLIQWFGTLRGFDTSAWVDGDILYYDPSAGGFTTTYPTSGIIVTVAAVINAGSGGSGSILIRPTKTQRITGGSGISVTQTTAGSNVAIASPVSIANGGTNGTATPTAGAVAYGDGSTYAFTSVGSTGQVLTSNGSGTPTWTTPASAITISDDTTTNSTRYPLFANQTTGSASTEYVSSTKLQYNPSTGEFTSTSFSGAGTGLTGTASSLSIGGNAATATSATTATNIDGGANGSVPYQTGSGTTAFLAAGTNGYIMTLAGGVPTWAAAPATGISITDDTTTNATRYLTFTSATTGSTTGENVSSTKLQFNPSSGELSSTSFSGAGTNLTGTALSLSIGGNAETVTDGVYTSGSYADPTWITSLSGSKVSGNISGNAANVTDTVAINNGGTGQTTASAAFNALSPVTTTGDLIIGNGTNSSTRLGIGANGYVLTSNGTTATWAASGGSSTPAAVSDQANTSTGYFSLPLGTTEQRPSTPQNGSVRMNSTIQAPEWYDATDAVWVRFSNNPTYSIDQLVIAGGGSGGAGSRGGAGGAGGYNYSTGQTVTAGTSYSVVVGGGGSLAYAYTNSNTNAPGTQGTNSSFNGVTMIGGGGGGGGDGASSGTSGGSGGGAWYTGSGGSGTSGQGYAGGTAGTSGVYGGGGGGGAGGVGGNGSNLLPGNGGGGVANSITGSSVAYAGGGSGANYNSSIAGIAVDGGGTGNNTNPVNQTGTQGAANKGGGGGSGGNGGSGVVIIRYAGSQRATGGTVTSSGGYTIHTFTTSGTFVA